MIRQIEITVIAATTVLSPNITEVKLCKGILSRVVVRPPPGPNWEVYFRLLHFDNAIIPDHINEWIPLEKEALVFQPNFNDWKGVYKVDIQLCSPQARYQHVIQIELEVQEKPELADVMQEFIQRGF